MIKAGFLFLFAIACGPSQDLGPAVTCSDVKLENSTGSCSLVANSACSDGSVYEIDCQDDSTCTCTMNGSIGKSIIASNSPSGFCANVSASSLHDLGAQCGWNLNP